MPHFKVVKRLALDPEFEPDAVERFIEEAKQQGAFLYMEIRKAVPQPLTRQDCEDAA